MATTVIDFSADTAAGEAFADKSGEAAFTYQDEAPEQEQSAVNKSDTGITAEQLQAIIATNNASSHSREQVLLEALQALRAGTATTPEVKEPVFDYAGLLDSDEAASLGDVGMGAVAKLVNAGNKQVASKYQSQIEAMNNQIKLLQNQLTAKFVEDFRKDGGDVLDTPQGKAFMQEIDPAVGMTRAEAAERLGRAYLNRQVLEASKKFKKPPMTTSGGAMASTGTTTSAIKKVEAELEALRQKPQSQLTAADNARRSALWAQFMRLNTTTEGT